MQLFQNSVLKQHLLSVNKDEVKNVYEIYKNNFLPKVKNIKKMKEE